MLERPDLPDSLIVARLEDEFTLQVRQLAFLPLGVDVNTAVFRVVAVDGTAYFLKLRKGVFDELSVAIPNFLKAQGVQAIIAPLETGGGRLGANLEPYKMILYHFIEGRNGYEVALTDRQWLDFGAALRGIHAVQLPPDLAGLIPREDYSPHWRNAVKAFQAQAASAVFDDPPAAELAAFMTSRRAEIDHLVARAHELASMLQALSPEQVLCHADMHAGNLLIGAGDGNAGGLYIVDWDNPMLAPKEKDFSLIGGCTTWNDPRDVARFYEGYGSTPVDPLALAYYRHERIVLDIAAFCDQLFSSQEGGKDRQQSVRYFTGQFLPGHEIDLAFRTEVKYVKNPKFNLGVLRPLPCPPPTSERRD